MSRKQIASSVLIFILGFVSCLIVLSCLNAEVHDSYLNNLRMQFRADQSIQAITATKNEDSLKTLVYRQNVVNTFGEESFDFFRSESSENGFWSSFQLFILKNVNDSTHNSKGEWISEGLERGKLAFSLDALGMKSRADEEWLLASKLAGYADKQNDFKKLISRMINSEVSSIEQ